MLEPNVILYARRSPCDVIIWQEKAPLRNLEFPILFTAHSSQIKYGTSHSSFRDDISWKALKIKKRNFTLILMNVDVKLTSLKCDRFYI